MRLYVKWTPGLEIKFKELQDREGEHSAAALLETSTRNLYDFVRGLSRGKVRATEDGQRVRPRKFIELRKVELLAAALEEPELDNVEALPQKEWKARGEWEIPKVEDAEETPTS